MGTKTMSKESVTSDKTLIRVSLSNEAFEKALLRYIDEQKPDPIQIKQIKRWTFHWQDDAEKTRLDEESSFIPTHAVSGELVVKGDYCAVTLSTESYWEGDQQDGSLFFSCQATARFLAKSEVENASSKTKEEKRADSKIRRKMIERLRTDDYISKLLTATEPLELCQATVQLKKDDPEAQLQERVSCSETTAEAIRRAIFSTSDAPIDVFDVVCSMPILPCTFHNQVLSETTPLADRAKLRLLEDAMYDACENEGEEELVEELQLEAKRTKR